MPKTKKEPEVVRHGVFFQAPKNANRDRGEWKVIMSKGDKLQYVVIPNTTPKTTKAQAEKLAQDVPWKWYGI